MIKRQTVFKMILLTFLCAISGWFLLTLVYLLPVSRMQLHIRNSAFLFEPELQDVRGYKETTGDRASALDYLSDAVMLLTAAYDSPEPAWKAAVYAELEGIEDEPAHESLLLLASDEADALPKHVAEYARYWHGYLVFLKPLFLLVGYGKIRYVLMYLHLGLFVLLQIRLFHTKKTMCLPFFFAWMFCHPVAMMLCMHYSWMTLCALVSMLTMLHFYEKKTDQEETDMDFWCPFFMLTGCATSFMDLLSHPLVTLGWPLVLWLSLYGAKKLRTDVAHMIGLSVSWGFGYGGMWSLKWLITTLFTEKKILADTWNQIKIRSGIAEFSYTDVLSRNVSASGLHILLLLAVVFLAGGVWLFIRHASFSPAFLLAACYPFAWYAVMQNHSYMHSHFTYRILSITIFAVLAILTEAFSGVRKQQART